MSANIVQHLRVATSTSSEKKPVTDALDIHNDYCGLDIGAVVWYKQKRCEVRAKHRNLYMIKDKRGNIYWIRPENVMVLNEGIQGQRDHIETR